jgi:hypothetical protein
MNEVSKDLKSYWDPSNMEIIRDSKGMRLEHLKKLISNTIVEFDL